MTCNAEGFWVFQRWTVLLLMTTFRRLGQPHLLVVGIPSTRRWGWHGSRWKPEMRLVTSLTNTFTLVMRSSGTTTEKSDGSRAQCEQVFAIVLSMTLHQPVYIWEAEAVAYRTFTLMWVTLLEVTPARRYSVLRVGKSSSRLWSTCPSICVVYTQRRSIYVFCFFSLTQHKTREIRYEVY